MPEKSRPSRLTKLRANASLMIYVFNSIGSQLLPSRVFNYYSVASVSATRWWVSSRTRGRCGQTRHRGCSASAGKDRCSPHQTFGLARTPTAYVSLWANSQSSSHLGAEQSLAILPQYVGARSRSSRRLRSNALRRRDAVKRALDAELAIEILAFRELVPETEEFPKDHPVQILLTDGSDQPFDHGMRSQCIAYGINKIDLEYA